MSHALTTRKSSIFAVTVVIYVMLFEWKLFMADALRLAVDVMKFLIPAALILWVPLRRPVTGRAVLFFVLLSLFLAWGLVPSFLSPKLDETLVQWVKFVPRLVVAALIASYVVVRPRTTATILKLLVIIGALAAIQFAVLLPVYLLELGDGIEIPGVNGTFFGPFGILGDQASAVGWYGPPSLRVLRLTGFWPEPSNASGFLLMAFFLGKALYTFEGRWRWKAMAYMCLLGGFATLAGAGYLAIAIAALWGLAVVERRPGRRLYTVVVGGLSIALLLFAVFSRLVATTYFDEVPLLRAAAGVRSSTELDIDKLYGGRLELLERNIQIWRDEPLGVGFRIPGQGFFDEASPSAPLLWMTYTGITGLMLLLASFGAVLCAAISGSRRSIVAGKIGQAWISLLVQHVSYGSWMSPIFLLVSVLVLLGDRAWEPREGEVIESERQLWSQPV